MSFQIEEGSTENLKLDTASDNTSLGLPEKEVTAKAVAKSGRATQKPSRIKSKESVNPITERLFSIGFIFALVLALFCLSLSVIYMFQYLNSANTGITQVLDKIAAQQLKLETGQLETLINGRLVMARLGLLSCGVLTGVAFGFLGFALFLLGIKESMNVDFDTDTYRAKVARMSPGLFSIVVAAVLIGVCATRDTPFNYSIDETKPAAVRDSTKRNSASSSSSSDNSNQSNDKPGLAPKIVDDQP